MSVSGKLTGKAQSLVIGGSTLPITKVTATTTRTLAEATDSTDYDAASDMLWESQIPVKLSQELKVEGRYNTATIPTAVVATLYSGAAAGTITWTLKTGVVYGHGLYDISDFEASAPVDDIVTYSLTAKLNGPFTTGS